MLPMHNNLTKEVAFVRKNLFLVLLTVFLMMSGVLPSFAEESAAEETYLTDELVSMPLIPKWVQWRHYLEGDATPECMKGPWEDLNTEVADCIRSAQEDLQQRAILIPAHVTFQLQRTNAGNDGYMAGRPYNFVAAIPTVDGVVYVKLEDTPMNGPLTKECEWGAGRYFEGGSFKDPNPDNRWVYTSEPLEVNFLRYQGRLPVIVIPVLDDGTALVPLSEQE